MRTFVIGDIHGAYRALKQVLERANFDYDNDTLISLGDVSDGWTEVAECFEELLKIKNLKFVRGNHDQWLKDWFVRGDQPDVWRLQGGQNTILSYEKHPELKIRHMEFLKKSPFYYVDEQVRLFVHGGIKPGVPIESHTKQELMWDRGLWELEYNGNLKADTIQNPGFKEVYVGHTSIYRFSGDKKPIISNNVIFMDTGAGWEGVLSLMDIDTKEVFQSDVVAELYPEVIGRSKHRVWN
jgi:serine/threonine protein phosphatase 1